MACAASPKPRRTSSNNISSRYKTDVWLDAGRRCHGNRATSRRSCAAGCANTSNQRRLLVLEQVRKGLGP